ncbi:MAG: hypothetical protein EA353_09365 [Puniceicoccaceae bacterium]|nr:MAG: hypothetical protein EA353_09365 [Puniceicoccaceae bacterium]
MSEDTSKYKKFKLLKPISDELVSTADSSSQQPAQEDAPAKPLELRREQTLKVNDPQLTQAKEMLADAYGAEMRAERRRKRIKTIKGFTLLFSAIIAFFAATLAYAHLFAGFPILKPLEWYLPFFLSAALSAWLCLKSLKFWQDQSLLLAIFGILTAGALAYWNVYVLRYAVADEHFKPSNELWAPTGVYDLYFVSEVNSLRGVAKSKTAYTQLSLDSYKSAFHAISRNDWRPYFLLYLSPDEMQRVNVTNINQMMHLTANRMKEKRATTWDELLEELAEPAFEFEITMYLLRPYTWILSYL